MSDWNTNLYLKFEKERTQPAKDLISRINRENPNKIIDLGCGPGNSTRELKNKWGSSSILGVDNSKSMLEKAKSDMPNIEWVFGDLSKDFSFLGKSDLLFSNALIQWIPNQEDLMKRLFESLNNDGVLAVQVPNVTDMPINIAVKETAANLEWQKHFSDFSNKLFFNELSFYYDVLSPLSKEIILWETEYYHILNGHEAIVEWYIPTGMKPYLDMLQDEELRNKFIKDVLHRVEKEYTMQKDGKVLFPFRRQFFIAYK